MYRFTSRNLSMVVIVFSFSIIVQNAWGTQYTLTDLGTFGGSQSEAFGINASGQVVGYAQTASGASHAFLYSG